MNLSQKLAGFGLAAAVAFGGATLIAPHEGRVLETYIDPVCLLLVIGIREQN